MKTTRTDPLDWIGDELAELAERGLRRAAAAHVGPQQVQLHVAARAVEFRIKRLFGLAADERLCQAADRAARAEGSARASPLVTGRAAANCQLEQRLAEFEGAEAALVFRPATRPTWARSQPWPLAAMPLFRRQEPCQHDRGSRLSAAVQVFPHRDL